MMTVGRARIDEGDGCGAEAHSGVAKGGMDTYAGKYVGFRWHRSSLSALSLPARTSFLMSARPPLHFSTNHLHVSFDVAATA